MPVKPWEFASLQRRVKCSATSAGKVNTSLSFACGEKRTQPERIKKILEFQKFDNCIFFVCVKQSVIKLLMRS